MIFPLRALLLRRSTAVVTIGLIAINVLCFLYEMAQPVYLQRLFVEHYALVPDHFRPSTLVTSMFLHGGWIHLISNMWFLWVFGSHVEDLLGSAKYLAFYLVSGIASAALQFLLNLGSPIPTLGASGAIAGVMGGFLLIYPRARVQTLVFILIFITTVELPAVIMLLYWFAIQLLGGLASFASFAGQGGIAWFAHVGGFLTGLLLIRIFVGDRPTRPRYSY